VVSTLAGSAGLSGYTNGTGSSARFQYPSSVAVDSAGNVYVSDGNNNAVRKITPAGVVSTPTVRMGMGGAWDDATLTQVAKNAITKDKMISDSVLTAFSGDIVSTELKTDSGDWKRVAAFANWAKAAYPARHYAFVIFGHGSGFFDAKKPPQKGTLMDIETKDYVTLPEMRVRVSQSASAPGTPHFTVLASFTTSATTPGFTSAATCLAISSLTICGT